MNKPTQTTEGKKSQDRQAQVQRIAQDHPELTIQLLQKWISSDDKNNQDKKSRR